MSGETYKSARRSELIAKTLFNTGVMLGALGRMTEAIAVYDEIAARFGTADEPVLREQVAKALANKGGRLAALGRLDEAIVADDEVVTRFGTAHEPALREQVAKALLNRGQVWLRKRELSHAALDFAQAIQLNPELAEKLNQQLKLRLPIERIRAIGAAGFAISSLGLIVGVLWPGPIAGLFLPFGLALLWIAQRLWLAVEGSVEAQAISLLRNANG
jgi:tetratricopeptide (TPR) repeat protein